MTDDFVAPVPQAIARAAWEAEWQARTVWASRQVHDVITAGFHLSSVDEWLVDVELRCPRCESEGLARFSLPTFVEFSKQLKAGEIRCECGAAFGSKESKIILL